MTRHLIGILIIAIATSAFAQDNNCNALLNHGIENTQLISTDYDFLSSVSDEYCSMEYSSLDSKKSASFGAVVKSIPISLTGNASDNKTKHSNFCKNFSSLTVAKTNQFAKTSTIFQGALNAWNRCQELDAKELSITPRFTSDNRSVSFTMFTRSSASFVFTGVDTISATCTIAGKKVGANEHKLLNSTATVMQCVRSSQRIPLQNDLVDYFPPASVVLKTGEGSTLIEFAEMINFPGRDRFAQLSAEIAGTKSLLSQFSKSFATTTGQTTDVIKESRAAIGGQWNELQFCPAGTYVSGISTFDADTGSKCPPCISHVRVTCTPFPQSTIATP